MYCSASLRVARIAIASTILALAIHLPTAAHSEALLCSKQCHFNYIACMEHKFTNVYTCAMNPSCAAQCQQNNGACLSACAGNFIGKGRR